MFWFCLVAVVAFVVLGGVRCAFAKDDMVLYSEDEVAQVRANIAKYDWAKAECDRVLKICEPWMARSDEEIWSLVTGQAIPRGIHVNPMLGCPSCGRDVYSFGNYPWKVSLDKPFKLECPSCSEVWPKNDFDAFRKSGLGKNGVFDRSLADESLLFNTEDPDGERKHFAVDDGMGWIEENDERWWFIAYYSHYCTWTEIPAAVTALAQAYIYTGDVAYAHKGAILLDRIADVYPEMDLDGYSKLGLYNSHGGTGQGRIQGSIWETRVAESLAIAYDLLYDGMAEDSNLVPFLSDKAKQWDIENDKSSLEKIRENIENNLLREFILSCQDRRIRGNEGMTQTTMATAAAVLDDPDETPKALAWIFEPGESRSGGGHVAATLIGEVDRDGVGNEAAPGYCFIWMHRFYRCAQVLDLCREHHDYDLHRDFPRLKRMYSVPYRLTFLDQYTPSIGDTGKTGSPGMASVNRDWCVDLFTQFGEPYYAQVAYLLNDNRVDGLHTSMFDKDPEAIQDAILKVIEEQGPLQLGSENMNGYGFAAFRHGTGDDRRGAWLYYGRNGGHGHRDRLNYGYFYRGMDVLPDLGYPEYADQKWPKRPGWTINTISHNTVMVDEKHQERNWIGQCQMYAASQGVGVIEVASPNVYPGIDDYRRTFVMVDINDAESYLVDFFRVKGGDDYVLSFHAGEGDVETQGLSLTAQEKGTYAGEEIAFGDHYDGAPDGRYVGSGFSYLYDVAREKNPKAGWWADWSLVDTWGTKVGKGDVNVRFHGLSDVDDVALAWGDPPQNKPGNPRRLRYALLHNEKSESAFVSVVEPYSNGTPNLKSVSRLDLSEVACGVRVETVDGRTDFVVSNDDPTQTLDLGDGVTVTGRFVMVSLRDGKAESVLLVGGQEVVTSAGMLNVNAPKYTAVVKDFQREESGTIWLDVTGDVPEDDRLVSAQLRVLNDGARDACYEIKHVTKTSDGVRFDLGDTSFIRGLQSLEDYSAGYVYNVSVGDSVEILNTVHVQFESGQASAMKASVDWTWLSK